MKINRLSPDEHVFLQRTTHLAKKPKSLYFIGSLPDHPVKTVAIVGSRRPTPYGRAVTESLSRSLAESGVVVISGMALGIDAIAHSAALDAGGTTIAVLAGGVDNPSPRSNLGLARRILEHNGALISEYEPGTSPRLYHFLERNRIVSGLSDAIIVTEATTKSGTLSTVTHALEQGKPVFAVPGNITSPLSGGCNHLIKQGAAILTDISDVLFELGIDPATKRALALGDNEYEAAILSLLREGIQDGDTLLLQSRLSTSAYNQTITLLEIKGMVRPLGANQWTISD